MILSKITLHNFRQFRGTQELTFACADKNAGANITVIFGENGRGKTGIFRAIMFCLFGDKRLSQDDEVEDNELTLVNMVEMRDRASGDLGQPVNMFVELAFTHRDQRFTLRREMLGMLDGGEIIEECGPVKLIYQDVEGNTLPITDPNDVATRIDSILDRRVKEYFLFDGEKIERLTRASNEQRREIARGIRNLLNIDALEIATKGVGRLKRKLDDELIQKSSGEYGKLLQNIAENEEEQSRLTAELENLEIEQNSALEQKKKIDREFDKHAEIRGLLDMRAELEERLSAHQEQAGNLLSEMKTVVSKASLLLLKDTIKNVFSRIEQQKQAGELPSEIRKDLIERILTESRCICGREVDLGSAAFDEIIKWKNRTTDVVLQDTALELWRYLSGVVDHKDDVAESVENKLQKYAVNRNECEQLRQKLQAVNSEIGAPDRKDAADLERQREYIDGELIKYEAERRTKSEGLRQAKERHEKYVAQREDLERNQNIKDELTERASLVQASHDALRKIHAEFTDEVKNLIGQKATSIFEQLLDEQDRETLNEIVVREDYSLQILDRWGKPFLANISAGQRQIMSIAFIAALALTAMEGQSFEMPLFMDTPFGRLSFEHRKNLIKLVPDFASQWILLATDTELRRQEASLLRRGGRWGKFYMLKPQGPGFTQIDECSVEQALAYLKDNVDEKSEQAHEYVG